MRKLFDDVGLRASQMNAPTGGAAPLIARQLKAPATTICAVALCRSRSRSAQGRARRARRDLRAGPCGRYLDDDAPFRETAACIAQRRRAGILAVEIEAASLYAFAAVSLRPVICLAHVLNQLGCVDFDFGKGDGNAAAGSLALVTALAAAWRRVAPAIGRAAS